MGMFGTNGDYSGGSGFGGSVDSLNNNLAGAARGSQDLAGQMYGADKSLQAARDSSGNALEGTKYSADKGLAGQKYGADKSLAGTQYSSDKALQGTQYSSDKSLQGQLAGYANDRTLQQGRINFQNQRFGDVLGALGSGSSSPHSGRIAHGADVSTAPIYDQRAIQGQINSQVAQNDARGAGQARQAQSDTAGRGLGTGSPLLDALKANIGAQTMSANNDAYRNTNFDVGKLNADHVLAAQQASNDAAIGYGGLQVQQEQNQMSGHNALLGLLGQLGSVSV